MTLHDLSHERTANRQREMMLALRRTGLGESIKSEYPEIHLDAAFDQWRARAFRLDAQRQVSVLVNAHQSPTLTFATWVAPSAVHPSDPAPEGPWSVVGAFVEAVRAAGGIPLAAVYEPDFDGVELQWQGTIHAIIASAEGRDRKTLAHTLRGHLAYGRSANPTAYRPLILKEVSNVEPLISYMFKGLAVLSATSRHYWRNGGKAFTAKRRLKTPQVRQLLQQTQRDGIEARVFLAPKVEVSQ